MTTSPSSPPAASAAGSADDRRQRWFALDTTAITERLGVDPRAGLNNDDAAERLRTYGPNEVATEPPPTAWQIAKGQIANPMNVMLLVVAIASFVIGQVSTGTLVGLLVAFNVIMGTNQER